MIYNCNNLFWKKISLRVFWSVFFVNSVKIDDDDEIVDLKRIENETFYFSKLSDTVLHQGISYIKTVCTELENAVFLHFEEHFFF